ncbi:hypothetical protein LJ655_17105 [Paraburkholderia sp. MMS20-SJTN17]|uniref:Uncharacterized protein n=1 Tax=Paraburkholderia translucens TaxID=2886945 RepID=A0ABS8KFR2_9BURK|nr:hypothetical protein [Paraburkholderia sp. MMS20-SJTN17]MCC8403588.1 hypothetical protein [Paraburkholderia sp. MMS20-SJTN17]
MQFDAELLLLAMAPVILACIGWEAGHFVALFFAQDPVHYVLHRCGHRVRWMSKTTAEPRGLNLNGTIALRASPKP